MMDSEDIEIAREIEAAVNEEINARSDKSDLSYDNFQLDDIGNIDENGYIYDMSGHRVAKIHESGYIISQIGDSTARPLGKIGKDGTITDPQGNDVGHIKENGYVYIHTRNVGRVSAEVLGLVTAIVWNGGGSSPLPDQQNASENSNNTSTEKNSSGQASHNLSLSKLGFIAAGIIIVVVVMISVLGGRETGSGQSSPLGGSVVSNAKLEDGEYYGHLKSWNDNSMTIEVLEFLGFDSASYKYLLKNTGKTISLDISQADVWLEDDWSISGPYYNFYSIDAAVDCSLYDGSLIRDKWTKDISFYVEDSVVKDIAILYSP